VSQSLTSLDLNAAKVTNAGLQELPRWANLKSLVLCRTKITDEGLKGLAGLRALESLDLSYTDCTGAGLAVLPNRKSLSRLEMIGAKVTDEGLRALTGMTSLDYVGLDGNSKLPASHSVCWPT
jgi:hypothetical protein